jgi:hypothetical protein
MLRHRGAAPPNLNKLCPPPHRHQSRCRRDNQTRAARSPFLLIPTGSHGPSNKRRSDGKATSLGRKGNGMGGKL